jgi:hypothetical protein
MSTKQSDQEKRKQQKEKVAGQVQNGAYQPMQATNNIMELVDSYVLSREAEHKKELELAVAGALSIAYYLPDGLLETEFIDKGMEIFAQKTTIKEN